MRKQMNDGKFRLKELFKSPWNPKPVEPPTVDPNLQELDPLTRSAESIRYSILSLEFWISPKGQVREWLRSNARLAILLAIPSFLVLPIITFVLWQLVAWLVALTSIAGKLIIFPILALLAVVMITVTVNIFKFLFRS